LSNLPEISQIPHFPSQTSPHALTQDEPLQESLPTPQIIAFLSAPIFLSMHNRIPPLSVYSSVKGWFYRENLISQKYGLMISKEQIMSIRKIKLRKLSFSLSIGLKSCQFLDIKIY